MKGKAYTGIIIALLVASAIVIVPLLLNEIIFNNDYYSKVSNDGWASFLGSYLGGILGGVATFGTLYFTIKDSNEKMRRQINSNDRPYVKVMCFDNPEQTEHFDYTFSFMENEYEIDKLTEVKFLMGFYNIGKGPAIDVKILECSYKDKNESVDINLRGNIAIGIGEKTKEKLSICISFDDHYLNMLKDDVFLVDGASINENSLKFKMQYYDINGNKFVQNMTARLVILTGYQEKIVSCTLSDFLYHNIEVALADKV